MEETTKTDKLQPIKKNQAKAGRDVIGGSEVTEFPTTVSISNAPRLFWTNACLEESVLLWSPTQISDSPSSTGSSARWPFISRKLIPLTESQRLGFTVCSLTNAEKLAGEPGA